MISLFSISPLPLFSFVKFQKTIFVLHSFMRQCAKIRSCTMFILLFMIRMYFIYSAFWTDSHTHSANANCEYFMNGNSSFRIKLFLWFNFEIVCVCVCMCGILFQHTLCVGGEYCSIWKQNVMYTNLYLCQV